MNKKYVDIGLFEQELEKLHYAGTIYVSEKMVDFIKKFPTDNVKEIVRGKWSDEIGDSHSSGKYRVCSNCGKNTFILWSSKQGLERNDYDFCPNCGAYMRKKIDNLKL